MRAACRLEMWCLRVEPPQEGLRAVLWTMYLDELVWSFHGLWHFEYSGGVVMVMNFQVFNQMIDWNRRSTNHSKNSTDWILKAGHFETLKSPTNEKSSSPKKRKKRLCLILSIIVDYFLIFNANCLSFFVLILFFVYCWVPENDFRFDCFLLFYFSKYF